MVRWGLWRADLTTLEGDRWDIPGHPLRFGRGWHDVALRVEGDAVADLERNFAQRWAEVTKERDLPHRNPEIDPGWQTPCQVVRTIPKHTYRFARKGDFGIAAAYRDAIARAKDFVYLENQYFWSPEVVDSLAEAMERNKDRRFRVVLVLPARADFGKYDNDKQVEYLREVDNGRGMFDAFSLSTAVGRRPGRSASGLSRSMSTPRWRSLMTSGTWSGRRTSTDAGWPGIAS